MLFSGPYLVRWPNRHKWPYMAIWPSNHMQQMWPLAIGQVRYPKGALKMYLRDIYLSSVGHSSKKLWQFFWVISPHISPWILKWLTIYCLWVSKFENGFTNLQVKFQFGPKWDRLMHRFGIAHWFYSKVNVPVWIIQSVQYIFPCF